MTLSAYHPFGYGDGFPTTLMIPAADRAGMHTYKFIAHETVHQWWGDNVVWRSYRRIAMAFAGGGACKAVQTTPLLSVEEAMEAMKKAKQSGYRPVTSAAKAA